MNHLYIAACDANGGIFHYTQNDDGSLFQKEFYPMKEPMYLFIREGRLFVLLSAPFDKNEDSGIFSYAINNDGSLTSPSEIISTFGKVGCHLYVSDDMRDIYCANYVSGSVFKSPDALVTHKGEGPSKPRQSSAHTHYVNETPDKKYIFATDLGLDTIFTYNNQLVEISKCKVPAGHGVRHLAYSSDGKTVFSANELASTVSAFDYSDGALTLKNTAEGLPAGFTGKSTMAAIRVKDDLIFASNRGHDSISCFEYKNGILKLLSVSPVGGSSPRDFDFVGDFVYSTNETTNNITVLKKEGDSLKLLPYCYSAPNPLCVVSICL